MAGDQPDLQAQGLELYQSVSANLLGGFQLLEEGLKSYLELYSDGVRLLIGGKLHFGFERADVEEAPMKRLVDLFAKFNADDALVRDLRGVMKHRNRIAHQAFLCMYGEAPPPEALSEMIGEAQNRAQQLIGLLNRVHSHTIRLTDILD